VPEPFQELEERAVLELGAKGELSLHRRIEVSDGSKVKEGWKERSRRRDGPKG
jgi:hypothetical protein